MLRNTIASKGACIFGGRGEQFYGRNGANIQQTTDNAVILKKQVEKALEEIGKLAHAGNTAWHPLKRLQRK